MRRTRRLLSNPESIFRLSLSEPETNRAIEQLQDSRLVNTARRLAELTASTYAYDPGAGVVTFRESGDSYSWNDVNSIPWNDPKRIAPSDVNRCFFLSFVEHASLLPDDAAAHLRSLHSYVRALAAAAAVSGKYLCIPWQPLTAARRLMNLLCALALIVDRDPTLAATSEFTFLLGHLVVLSKIVSYLREDDLAYNHLASQFFALALYAFVFDSRENAFTESARFIDCIEEQLGADGMQMERSATYQAHLLAHLEVLQAGGLLTGSLADRLNGLADRMRSALAIMTHPNGNIASLNDAAVGDGPPPFALGVLPGPRPDGITSLKDAGYARLVAGDFTGIFDAGPSGPDDNPGHAHADFLSLDLSFAGQLLFADPGVATYKNVPERDWTRSASVHNGPAFAGLEPLEFLGPFRIGRRGKAHFLPDSGSDAPIQTSGWNDGFDHFGGRVARWIGMWPGTAIMIVDVWSGLPERAASSSFLVPDTWDLRIVDAAKVSVASRQKEGNLTLSAINGTLSVDFSARYFPYGPRLPHSATRISLTPVTEGSRRSAALAVFPSSANLSGVNFLEIFTRREAALFTATGSLRAK